MAGFGVTRADQGTRTADFGPGAAPLPGGDDGGWELGGGWGGKNGAWKMRTGGWDVRAEGRERAGEGEAGDETHDGRTKTTTGREGTEPHLGHPPSPWEGGGRRRGAGRRARKAKDPREGVSPRDLPREISTKCLPMGISTEGSEVGESSGPPRGALAWVDPPKKPAGMAMGETWETRSATGLGGRVKASGRRFLFFSLFLSLS